MTDRQLHASKCDADLKTQVITFLVYEINTIKSDPSMNEWSVATCMTTDIKSLL